MFVVFNRWVDGTHHVGTYETYEEARARMLEYGNVDYPRGRDKQGRLVSCASDDGDWPFIQEVPEGWTAEKVVEEILSECPYHRTY